VLIEIIQRRISKKNGRREQIFKRENSKNKEKNSIDYLTNLNRILEIQSQRKKYKE
jgi:CRP-like cAMP-binding protein